MLFQLKKQSEPDRMCKSRRVKELALKGPFFGRAQRVMFYASTGEEVDTRELMDEAWQRGKTVLLPSVDGARNELVPVVVRDRRGLVKGKLGIYEPVIDPENLLPPSELELVFVPGIAFDKWGNRLGRGGGFYDRFLAKLSPRAVKVGLAFDFQLVENVPLIPGHDVPLDLVISN